MLDGGCVTAAATQQITDPGKAAMVNGLELDPAPGVSLTLDSATGTLSSNGGNPSRTAAPVGPPRDLVARDAAHRG